MAFDASGWVCFGHGAGSTKLFHYKTDDLITAVDDSGYFNAVYDQVSKGDVILVSGDLDGTPANIMLTVNSATGATTVTTVAMANATLNLVQNKVLNAHMAAIGTGSTKYLTVDIPTGFTGAITNVQAVIDTAGAGSGGTSTITISVPTTGAVATLAFAQDVAAGAVIEDTSITAHSGAAGNYVITIVTDGTGSHTGGVEITIEFTLTAT